MPQFPLVWWYRPGANWFDPGRIWFVWVSALSFGLLTFLNLSFQLILLPTTVKLWVELEICRDYLKVSPISPCCAEALALLRPIKQPYICQTPVNMHSLHGKVSVYRTWGRDGGTIGTFHFSQQSKQSEDFLNQRRKSVRWTTSLTETWRPTLAAGRANNLWDLLWRATPSNCSTHSQNQTHTCTQHTCTRTHSHQRLILQRITTWMSPKSFSRFWRRS